MHLWGVGAGTGRRWTPPPPTPPSWLFFICLISVYCVPVRFYWASVFSGASLSDSIFFFPRPFLSLISLNFISSNEFVISPNLCMSSLWAFFMEGIASVNCFGLKKKLWWNTYFHSLPAFQRPFSGECSSLDGKFCCFLFFDFSFLITAAQNSAWVVFLNCSLAHHETGDQLICRRYQWGSKCRFHPTSSSHNSNIPSFSAAKYVDCFLEMWNVCVLLLPGVPPALAPLLHFPLLIRKDRLSHLTVSHSCGEMNSFWCLLSWVLLELEITGHPLSFHSFPVASALSQLLLEASPHSFHL